MRRRQSRFSVYGLADWEEGAFLGLDDSALLMRAARQELTLVTYDRRTIPPILKAWAQDERRHGGVIFIDEKTLSPSDIRGLVRALLTLIEETGDWDWTDRVCFLRRCEKEKVSG
ncbi:MAG: hypothetical protein ABSF71_02640 [Terriglobia bacterium]